MDMLHKNFESYLSKPVHHILVELARTTEFQQKVKYIRKNLMFDWSTIQLIFGDLNDDFNILEQSDNWYLEKLENVWLVLHNAQEALLAAQDEDTGLDRLWELCTFTGYQDQLKSCFYTFKKNSKIGGVHVVLKLTAMLERLIGNIFLIKGKTVPFLLRDLLNTSEIQNLLGKIPVTFMQLLFGSPKGLNIRNVTWHGFIVPEELHPSLVCSLFLLFPSIGQLLTSDQVFPLRPQITSFAEYTKHLEHVFPDILDHHESVLDILQSSRYISSQHLNLWKASCQLYTEEKYGDCLTLLFPQFEHLLRSIYCDTNKCPQRLLTAESTSLYTTLDEILLPRLPNQDYVNVVVSVLGEGTLQMLEDILSFTTGPRLRDKLSHGECSLQDIPRSLVNHVFCIALSVCIKANKFQVDIHNTVTDQSQGLKYTDCSYHTDTFQDELLSVCINYRSKFHVGIILQRSVVEVIHDIGSLTNLTVPSDLVLDEVKTESQVSKLKNYIFGCINVSSSECVDILLKECLQIKLNTLHRPRYEIEVIVLLSKVVKNISETTKKITEGNNERYSQWQARTLRSRTRQTYQRMHQAVPTLQSALFCIVAINIIFLKILHQNSSEECDSIIRFARKMLKVVENTSSFCDFEKNRWNESCKIVSDFSEPAIIYLELNKMLL